MISFHSRTRRGLPRLVFMLIVAIPAVSRAQAQGLPPVPFPAENPPTEAKRILGKILFWDEQLSSDDTVACGTCHRPAVGGADPRLAINPGPDGIRDTGDDIHGSFGVVRRDSDGTPIEDPTFGFDPQVTGRAAPSFFGSLYAPEQFWDGRASSTFTDPLDGTTVLIANRGALESQAVGPVLNHVEMARDGRTWAEVTSRLETARPLRLADDRPDDAAAAIDAAGSYPALFERAFGDDAITPARIAFAIATYERSLVPDQTPWDRFIAGNTAAMTAAQVQGWNVFRSNGALCNRCHTPPFFTNHDFLNVGLRPAAEDQGRLAVSGDDEDFGDMKVAGLRNVGLRARLMHTGGITGVPDAIDFYLQARGHQFFLADQDAIPPNNTPMTQIRIGPGDRVALIDFLSNALTDPRAAAETFPFDRPTLASEAGAGVVRCSDFPRDDCHESLDPERSRLSITHAAEGDSISWKLGALDGTSADELGDPTSADGVVLCVYDGDAEALVFEGRAPADDDCTDGSCWRAIGSATPGRGWRYTSAGGSNDGARKLTFKAGASGKTKLAALFAGDLSSAPLGMPDLPLALPITVQMQSSAGSCWTATYTGARSNLETAFQSR